MKNVTRIRLLTLLLILTVLITSLIPATVFANTNNGSNGVYGVLNTLVDNSVDLIRDLFNKGADYFKEIVALFIDMGSHWADETVGRLVDLGVINGYPDGTFKPDNTITRAEFSTIVRKAFNYDEKVGSSFGDTDGHWAKNEVYTLVKAGVIDKSEYGDSYMPDKNITRIEMAKMIVRAAGLGNEAIEMAGDKTKFTDNTDIPSKDRGYIIIASDKGIINGYPEGTFKPYGEATRAEASTMVINALEYLLDADEEIEEEDIRDKDGLVDVDKLPKKTFKEEGMENVETKITVKRDYPTSSFRFYPGDIVDIDESHLPLKYHNLKINEYRFDKYEDTFLYGISASRWGRGVPVDFFIVECEVLEECNPDSMAIAFLDKDGNILKKMGTQYILEWELDVPINVMALEAYPHLPVSVSYYGALQDSGRVTLMYLVESTDVKNVTEILLYNADGNTKTDKTDVLRIKID